MSTVQLHTLSSDSEDSTLEGSGENSFLTGTAPSSSQTREESRQTKAKRRKPEADSNSKTKKKRTEKKTIGWILGQFWKTCFTVGFLEDVIQKVDKTVENISEKKWIPIISLWSCLRILMTKEMIPVVTDAQVANEEQRRNQMIQPPLTDLSETSVSEKSRSFFAHACSCEQADKLFNILKHAEVQLKGSMETPTYQSRSTDVGIRTFTRSLTGNRSAANLLSESNTVNHHQTSSWLDDDQELNTLMNSAQFSGSICYSTYAKGSDGYCTLKTPAQDGSTLYQLSVYDCREVKHVNQKDRWRYAKRRITVASQYPGDRIDQIMREFVHVATDLIVQTEGVVKETRKN